MPRVICTLPNASTLISGVKFEPHAGGGMISENISDEKAKRFASIPGYEIAKKGGKNSKQDDENSAAEKESAKQAEAAKAEADKAKDAAANSDKPASPAEPKKGDDKAAK